jgi:uncharacterized membrane protein
MMFLPVHPLWIAATLVLILLVVLVVWAATSRGSSSTGSSAAGPRAPMPPAPGGEAPIDLLKRRLAAGEITPDEFDRTRKLLES